MRLRRFAERSRCRQRGAREPRTIRPPIDTGPTWCSACSPLRGGVPAIVLQYVTSTATIGFDNVAAERAYRRIKSQGDAKARLDDVEHLPRIAPAPKGWADKQIFNDSGGIVAAISDRGVRVRDRDDAVGKVDTLLEPRRPCNALIRVTARGRRRGVRKMSWASPTFPANGSTPRRLVAHPDT